LFASVPAGAKGTFSLLYVPFDLIGKDRAEICKQALKDLKVVAEGMKEMFLTYGFSAKRTSGYGVAEDELVRGEIKTRAGSHDLTGKKLSELTQEVENVSFE
jgi:CRISPR-associated protein Cmr2